MLTPNQAVSLLVDRGHVGANEIVDGGLHVEDLSRRNLNLRVQRNIPPSYVLKLGLDAECRRTVAHELQTYRYLHATDRRNELSQVLAVLVDMDHPEPLVALEAIDRAVSLETHMARTHRLPTAMARSLGRAIGRIHRLTSTETARAEYRRRFGPQQPWALSFIHAPHVGMLPEISNANTQLVRILQSTPEFCASLDGLRDQWREQCLVHGDLRWDNCLAHPAPGATRLSRLRIIDWELSLLGDPCWDVGTVFANCLNTWLLSAPVTGETPPEQVLHLAQIPLERIGRFARAFWSAYVAEVHLQAAEKERTLRTSALCCGARVLQHTFEAMQGCSVLTGRAICMLQLSQNIIEQPEDAARDLLDLGADLD